MSRNGSRMVVFLLVIMGVAIWYDVSRRPSGDAQNDVPETVAVVEASATPESMATEAIAPTETMMATAFPTDDAEQIAADVAMVEDALSYATDMEIRNVNIADGRSFDGDRILLVNFRTHPNDRVAHYTRLMGVVMGLMVNQGLDIDRLDMSYDYGDLVVAEFASVRAEDMLAFHGDAIDLETLLERIEILTVVEADTTMPTAMPSEAEIAMFQRSFDGTTDVNVSQIQIADGRPNGGIRALLVTYETTVDESISDMARLLGAVTGTIVEQDIELDSVSLIYGYRDGVDIATVQVDDLMAFYREEITVEELFERIEIVPF